jgi:thioredoxin 1
MTEITDRDFNKEVLECELPVFVCFITRWSRSSYATCLFADKLATEYDGRVKFVKLDVGEIPRVIAGYRISAVPTILIFKDSQSVKKLIGFQNRSSMRLLLNSVTDDDETTGTVRVLGGIRALY